MNKEFDFLNIISQTLKNSDYLGDDCAHLKEYNLVISQDSLIEDVHFSSSYMTPYEIAKKAMLVNISDILASGGVPKFATIALSGSFDDLYIKDFYLGIEEVASSYNLKILGGDLTASDKVMVSITILGDTKGRNISSRRNAKEGYIVAVKGEFGSSAKGLFCLQNNIENDYYTKIHKEPVLYPEVSCEIAKKTDYPYAMMDSSDGLIDCLYQISKKSKVRVDVDFDKIPKKIDNKDYILWGGEDYSLVCMLHPDDFKKIKDLKAIGFCSSGDGIYLNNEKLEYRGFKHFEKR